jgi:HEAT repeat
MTAPTPTTAPIAAAVVPPHAGSDPLAPPQMRRARVRIALQELTALVEDLEASSPEVRQAACQALAALVELQAILRAQP